jgi:rhodanese-related sulfurtransferase
MTPVIQALRLLGISIVLGLLPWAVRGDRLPLLADATTYALDLPAPLVSVEQARRYYAEGSHYFLDTRPQEHAGSGAVPGSFVIREASFDADLEAAMDFLYPEDALILYGEDNPLPVGAVAARLQSRGYANLLILQGGLAAWRQAGGPLDDAEADHE